MPALTDLDQLDTDRLVTLMHAHDLTVADAVGRARRDIVAAIDVVTGCLAAGGRLVYVGAGTSGRLALLDASEAPPTFGTDPSTVTALIAGGVRAVANATEDAEDDEAAGRRAIDDAGVGPADAVVGIAASGRTPFVAAALAQATTRGAATIAVSCVPGAEISSAADVAIEVDVGPEFIDGSTRLKAGTAQKMVLNMISTIAMIKLGKTYGNLMVDLRPTNAKLRRRAGGLGSVPARQRLADHGGRLRDALAATR